MSSIAIRHLYEDLKSYLRRFKVVRDFQSAPNAVPSGTVRPSEFEHVKDPEEIKQTVRRRRDAVGSR